MINPNKIYKKYGLWVILSSVYNEYEKEIKEIPVFKKLIKSLGPVNIFDKFVKDINNIIEENPNILINTIISFIDVSIKKYKYITLPTYNDNKLGIDYPLLLIHKFCNLKYGLSFVDEDVNITEFNRILNYFYHIINTYNNKLNNICFATDKEKILNKNIYNIDYRYSESSILWIENGIDKSITSGRTIHYISEFVFLNFLDMNFNNKLNDNKIKHKFSSSEYNFYNQLFESNNPLHLDILRGLISINYKYKGDDYLSIFLPYRNFINSEHNRDDNVMDTCNYNNQIIRELERYKHKGIFKDKFDFLRNVLKPKDLQIYVSRKILKNIDNKNDEFVKALKKEFKCNVNRKKKTFVSHDLNIKFEYDENFNEINKNY